MSPAVAAVFAAVVAIGATLAIERLGGRRGGVLAAAPTTIVPFSIGLWSNDPQGFADALGLVPAGTLVNAMFLLTWRLLPPRLPAATLPVQLGVMVVASLSVWGVAARLLVALGSATRAADVPTWALGLVALVVGVVTGVVACWDAPPAPKGGAKVPLAMLLARGLLAALAIGVAIPLSKTAGPHIAGMASVFPAIFLTTMAGLWVSQGAAVPLGAVGPMVLGATSVSVYALSSLVWYPAVGPWWGAGLSWVTAVSLSSAPAMLWLQRRAG